MSRCSPISMLRASRSWPRRWTSCTWAQDWSRWMELSVRLCTVYHHFPPQKNIYIIIISIPSPSIQSPDPNWLQRLPDTSEGLELCFALSYYSRIRLLTNLLPLLRKSPRPRVLTVLNAGKEKPVIKEDLGLEDEENWSAVAAVNHTTTATTLALDILNEDPSNKNITFMHAFPGLVRTDIFSKLKAPETSSYLWWFGLACIRNIVGFMMLLKGINPEDSGKRQTFHLTSDSFGPGSVHLIDESGEEVAANSVLKGYRDEGLGRNVWDFTMRVFDKALGSVST